MFSNLTTILKFAAVLYTGAEQSREYDFRRGAELRQSFRHLRRDESSMC